MPVGQAGSRVRPGDLVAPELVAMAENTAATRRAAGEVTLRERLKRAKIDGELPPHLDPAEYARFILTVMEGMSVRAAGGASRRNLHSVADLALTTWPV